MSEYLLKAAILGTADGESASTIVTVQWVTAVNIEGEGFMRLNIACPRRMLEQAFTRLAGVRTL